MVALFFNTWKDLSARLNKSVSGCKRDEKDDPDFPRKTQTGPNRVGFLNTHVDAYVELVYARARHSKPARSHISLGLIN